MGSIWPITIIVVAYLLFVLKIGPEFMKFRQEYKIKEIVILYNGIQVLLSSYILKEVKNMV